MSKRIYLGVSVLDLRKTVMYEFLYDYVKPENDEKEKLSLMGADSFNVHLKADDIYEHIAEEVETKFDTSIYEFKRPIPQKRTRSLLV